MAWTVISGASSGIGAAVAEVLARDTDMKLLLLSRREAHLSEACRRLREQYAGAVEYIALDVRFLRSTTRFTEWLAAHSDVRNLVNCAGIGVFAPTRSMSWHAFHSVIATNLEGAFLLTQQFVRGTCPSPGTRRTIVNVCSDAAHKGFSDAAAYCASKSGMAGLSRAWQVELREHGFGVCDLRPGRVDTCFNCKSPGMRPGSLSAAEVAEVVKFVLTCSANIEITRVSIDSMSRQSDL